MNRTNIQKQLAAGRRGHSLTSDPYVSAEPAQRLAQEALRGAVAVAWRGVEEGDPALQGVPDGCFARGGIVEVRRTPPSPPHRPRAEPEQWARCHERRRGPDVRPGPPVHPAAPV